MARNELTHVHLASGLVLRDGSALLVASRYPNHESPLWNLPGGRQQAGELLSETAVREFFEETGLRASIRELAYVSESYDRETNVHFVSATFLVEVGESSFDDAQGCASVAGAQDAREATELRMTPRDGSDHVVAVEWVPVSELASRIVVGVVREPLLAYLRGELPSRFAGFHEAGITIEWPRDSA